MYKALYRTWRPRIFEDIVGQEHIVKTLKNQVKTKKIAHSYLFTGSRGIGKTTCSKVFAKAINCLDSKDGNPCGLCKNCIDFENGTLTDTVEMDAASNNGVDDIRSLREEAVYLPVSAKYRVYIIDEAHMLSKGAFNALLKIMEEPPAHVVFILATTELNRVPATIISRCQRFDFFRVSPLDIKEILLKISKEEEIDILEDAALNIGLIANGSVRDAISLLDQTSSLGETITEELVNKQAGTADRKKTIELAEYIIEKRAGEALFLIDELYKLSIDLKNITSELLLHFRNIMLAKELKNPKELIFVSDFEWNKIEFQAQKLNLATVLHAIEVLATLYEDMSGGMEAKALFEAAILRLTSPNLDSSLFGILKRISDMEDTIEEKTHVNRNRENEKIKESTIVNKSTQEVKENKNIEQNIDEKTEDLSNTSAIKYLDVEANEFVFEERIEEKEKEVIVTETDYNEDVQEYSDEKEKTPLPETLQVDEKLMEWEGVLEYLKKKNPPLEATLEGSVAYVKADLILIDAPNTVFFDLMRASEQTKESLRQAIEIKTGKQFRLGPVKKGTKIEKAENNNIELLKEQAIKLGLKIKEI